MDSLRSILGLGLLAGVLVLCTGAGDNGSAASQPANWKVTDDPNWIAPNSWQRHFTIPSFVETPRGMDLKTAASKPAADLTSLTGFRSTRPVSSSSTGSTASTASKTGTSTVKSTSSKSERSTRSSSSSHRSERSSSRSSRSSSSHSSHSSGSTGYGGR